MLYKKISHKVFLKAAKKVVKDRNNHTGEAILSSINYENDYYTNYFNELFHPKNTALAYTRWFDSELESSIALLFMAQITKDNNGFGDPLYFYNLGE